MDAHPARQNARGVLLLAHSATLRNPQERLAQIVATALAECRSCRQGVAEQPGAVSRFGVGSRSRRSEEHTSEHQSLMRRTYAAFCLKHKTHHKQPPSQT